MHNLDALNGRIHKLNVEFADTLMAILVWIRQYCDEYNIPMRNEDSIYTLLYHAHKINRELIETMKLTNSRKLPPFKSDGEKPDKLPEP